MKRRYWIAAGIVTACIGVVLVAFVMLPSGPGPLKGQYDRIEPGMTIEAVEQLFGSPAPDIADIAESPSTEIRIWHGEDGSSALIFFENRKVSETHWFESTETIGDKVCRWLGWPWW